jgi:hypothetical protein
MCGLLIRANMFTVLHCQFCPSILEVLEVYAWDPDEIIGKVSPIKGPRGGALRLATSIRNYLLPISAR